MPSKKWSINIPASSEVYIYDPDADEAHTHPWVDTVPAAQKSIEKLIKKIKDTAEYQRKAAKAARRKAYEKGRARG